MIAVAVVSSSVIDRGAFMPSAQQVTGLNHVSEVDRSPGLSRLDDDMKILNNFAATDVNLATSVTFLGILAAGFDEDIDEFIAYCRGMPHLPTTRIQRRGVRAVVVAGNLDQWRVATIDGCRAPAESPVRQAFNAVYKQLTQMGLGPLFQDYRTVDTGRGQFLLEKK